jgi:hypothetical protein
MNLNRQRAFVSLLKSRIPHEMLLDMLNELLKARP